MPLTPATDTPPRASDFGGGQFDNSYARLPQRLYARLTPTPDLSVFLDTSPEEAYRRKAEYPLAYQRTRWTAYQRVRPWVRTAVTLSNADLQSASATLHGLVMDRIGAA